MPTGSGLLANTSTLDIDPANQKSESIKKINVALNKINELGNPEALSRCQRQLIFISSVLQEPDLSSKTNLDETDYNEAAIDFQLGILESYVNNLPSNIPLQIPDNALIPTYDSNKELEFCSESRDLKLGRIYLFRSMFRQANADCGIFNGLINKTKAIPNLLHVEVGRFDCFSIRLSKSILQDESKILAVINAIRLSLNSNEYELEIAARLITTIESLVKKYRLFMAPSTPKESESVHQAPLPIVVLPSLQSVSPLRMVFNAISWPFRTAWSGVSSLLQSIKILFASSKKNNIKPLIPVADVSAPAKVNPSQQTIETIDNSEMPNSQAYKPFTILDALKLANTAESQVPSDTATTENPIVSENLTPQF